MQLISCASIIVWIQISIVSPVIKATHSGALHLKRREFRKEKDEGKVKVSAGYGQESKRMRRKGRGKTGGG